LLGILRTLRIDRRACYRSHRQAQRDLLQNFDQHIVVEGAMKLRVFRHRPMCAFVQGYRGSVSVHRRPVVETVKVGIRIVQFAGPSGCAGWRSGMYRVVWSHRCSRLDPGVCVGPSLVHGATCGFPDSCKVALLRRAAAETQHERRGRRESPPALCRKTARQCASATSEL
jgi:hypothetical protein